MSHSTKNEPYSYPNVMEDEVSQRDFDEGLDYFLPVAVFDEVEYMILSALDNAAKASPRDRLAYKLYYNRLADYFKKRYQVYFTIDGATDHGKAVEKSQSMSLSLFP